MASRQGPRSETTDTHQPAENGGSDGRALAAPTETQRDLGAEASSFDGAATLPETQTEVVSVPEAAERTDVVPRATPPPPPPLATPTGDGRRTRVSKSSSQRRIKRTVANVDLWSVLKLSLFFYLVGFGLWMLFVASVYRVVESFGVFDTIEEFIGNPGVRNAAFDISLGSVERYAALIGGAFVLLGCIANLFLAILYNLFSSVLGGLQLTFIERADQ